MADRHIVSFPNIFHSKLVKSLGNPSYLEGWLNCTHVTSLYFPRPSIDSRTKLQTPPPPDQGPLGSKAMPCRFFQSSVQPPNGRPKVLHCLQAQGTQGPFCAVIALSGSILRQGIHPLLPIPPVRSAVSCAPYSKAANVIINGYSQSPRVRWGCGRKDSSTQKTHWVGATATSRRTPSPPPEQA